MRPGISPSWGSCTVLLALCVSTGAQAENAAADFSAEERALLAQGELLMRPLHKVKNGLDLIGGSSWQVIDESPDLVWRAIHDVSRYHKLLPAVVEARVVEARPERSEIYVRNGVWPIYASYYLVLREDVATRTLEFAVDQDRPHALTAGWGFARVLPYGRSKTLMAFAIMADLGRGILATVARSLVHSWMLKVPFTVKTYLESGGRNYYLPKR